MTNYDGTRTTRKQIWILVERYIGILYNLGNTLLNRFSSNEIASSLYPSFLSIQYSPRFVTDFDFFFQTDNFIINSSSIYSILVSMHQEDFYSSHYKYISLNCCRSTRKTDKVYDFLQSANLTCVDDLSTQKLEPPPCSAIYQNDVGEWRGTFARWLANRTSFLGWKVINEG